MRICVAATPQVAVPTLNYLLESEHQLVSVITQPDRPAGRGRIERESPVSQWANSKGVNCFKPVGNEETIAALNGADLLITIGYGVILDREVFAHPKYGSINLHFSLLPRWRGAAPVQRAIEAGDQVSGVTVFSLDEGMDTGPIYTQLRFALDEDITSDELFLELGDLGQEAIAQTLQLIAQGAKPHPQPRDGACGARKISKDEAKIDWHLPAHEVSQKIRAFTSVPGAWTIFRESPIKIFSPSHTDLIVDPGVILVEAGEVCIGTKTTALQIGALQPAGKAVMPASAWINGVRLNPGEIFG